MMATAKNHLAACRNHRSAANKIQMTARAAKTSVARAAVVARITPMRRDIGRVSPPSHGGKLISVDISRTGALLVPSDNTCDHVCEEPGECRLNRHPRYWCQAPSEL